VHPSIFWSVLLEFLVDDKWWENDNALPTLLKGLNLVKRIMCYAINKKRKN